MSEKIGLGVIGCGIISDAHLNACTNLDDVEIVAAYNRTESRLNRTAKTYDIPNRYLDWRDLIADEEVDAVVICLPEGLHKPVVLEAAQKGKHVLLEKPMSRNLKECEAMIAASEDAQIMLMVAQVTRQVDSQVLAKQWLDEGRIGRVSKIVRRRIMQNAIASIEGRPWVTDPDLAADFLLYGFGSHEYDAILWLLDTEADTVIAEQKEVDADWSGWYSIYSTVDLCNGVTAEVSLALCSDTPVWDTVVTGSAGTLSFSNNGLELNGEETEAPLDLKKAFTAQMKEFVDCISTGRKPGSSGKNVKATMMLLEGVDRSLREERIVQIS